MARSRVAIEDMVSWSPFGIRGTRRFLGGYVGIVSSKDHPDRDNFVTGFEVVNFPFDSSARPEAST